ncbi:MAG: hypothetical protein LBM77_12760 [Spirochaetaceae bacterium]|jgi:hypothetical protein|nr:hypothetical protein [Spirochaetaceae bacterium]
MTHAYNELYREQATRTFAEMMDYAVNDCRIPGDIFLSDFIKSGIAAHFEIGQPDFVAGHSGIELANLVLKFMNKQPALPQYHECRTPEYWAGWVLAQYQWYSAHTFSDILTTISFSGILALYPTYHEADITKFFDAIEPVPKLRNSMLFITTYP